MGDQAEVEEEPSGGPDAGPEVPAAQADAESAVAPANDVAMPQQTMLWFLHFLPVLLLKSRLQTLLQVLGQP